MKQRHYHVRGVWFDGIGFVLVFLVLVCKQVQKHTIMAAQTRLHPTPDAWMEVSGCHEKRKQWLLYKAGRYYIILARTTDYLLPDGALLRADLLPVYLPRCDRYTVVL